MANFSDSFNLSLETIRKLENLPVNPPQTQGRRLTRSKTQNFPQGSTQGLPGDWESDEECVEASPNNSLQQNASKLRRKQRKVIRKNKSDSVLGKYAANPPVQKSDSTQLDVTMLEQLLETVEEDETPRKSRKSVEKKHQDEGMEAILEMPISSEDLVGIEFSDWETSNIFRESQIPPQEGGINKISEHPEVEEDFNVDSVSFVASQVPDKEIKAHRKEVSQMIKDFYTEEDSFMPLCTQGMSQMSFRKNEKTLLEATKLPSQDALEAPAADAKFLSSWGLPEAILAAYAKKGIKEMFQWQVECLSNRRTLLEGENLVYSAPTSAGKTLVSEILMIKTILERQKKAILILPFISVVREKMLYLRDLLAPAGIRVEAVCTIEKANSIFNRLLEQQNVSQVGIVVVDEIHLISDPNRGYILELLLAKILYTCRKMDFSVQVIGMSATLPNLELLCRWLSAEYYHTDFRPVELKEMIKIGPKILSNRMEEIRVLDIKHEKTLLEATKLPSQDALEAPATDAKFLSSWGLPEAILTAYAKKGIKEMFQWQVECLSNRRTLLEGENLVYSAPTSAGKTLKMLYLRDLLAPAGIRVEGFFGGYAPPGGFESCHVAVCTIEKANSIFNRLLEQQNVSQVGIVVVDEIHLISDPNRGYILELLLAKILYTCRKMDFSVQVIGMSATLPNLELLCRWLSAEFYHTDFRPVELKEMIKIGPKILSNRMEEIRVLDIKGFSEICSLRDQDNVGQLVLETICEGCGVIIFCPSKDWCEKLCLNVAEMIYKVGRTRSPLGAQIRETINRDAIESLREELLACPTGLDEVLAKCIGYACAFHHAGLTTEERDAIEGGFRMGALRVLVATSTLSSGVNLPARRVIVRTPMFGRQMMNPLTYRQMIGRAGRTGKDTLGEAILVCDEVNVKAGKELLTRELEPISSCLDVRHAGNLRRALLEIVASGMATSRRDLHLFFTCTLIWAEKGEVSINLSVKNSPERKKNKPRGSYACLASSIPPSDGFLLFSELQKSRQCFVLESELHAVYLVTPFTVCQQLPEIDWLHFLDLWEHLPVTMRRVGELVGVRDAFLVRAMRTKALDEKALQIHKRFYTALALQELISEVPIGAVAAKYKCPRGLLQSLQQMAASFAAIVAAFCAALNWQLLAMIVSQFRERLFFGIHRDLVDLMRAPSINAKRARALFRAGIETLLALARMGTTQLAKILHDAACFDTEAQRDGEADHEARERNILRKICITGQRDLSIEEAAREIRAEARRILEEEMGGKINWEDEAEQEQPEDVPEMTESFRKVQSQQSQQINSSIDEIPCSQSPAALEASKKIQKTQMSRILRSSTARKSLKILHICKDEKSFREFTQRLENSPEIALALMLEKKQERSKKIGAKLLAKEENSEEEPRENFRIDQETILAGLAVTCNGKEVAVIELGQRSLFGEMRKLIWRIFNRENLLIHAWEVREKLKLLAKFFPEVLDTKAAFADPQIANWLLQPDEATTSFHRIVMLHCPDMEALLAQPEAEETSGEAQSTAECAIVYNLRTLSTKLVAAGDGKLLRVFRELEMPIQVQLFRMEVAGFPANPTEMEKSVAECQEKMEQLEKKIFTLHGRKFNISSSRSVAKILGIQKEKGKLTTNRGVLEKLGSPLAHLIAQHRTLTAVFVKVLQPLARSIQGSRIHGTSFSLTQTGRITMHEPNLQTVAKDFLLDLGDGEKQILSCRKVFAPGSGQKLVSADFCQLELRILIHFAQDPILIQIIKSDCDIFRAVAARWSGIAEAKITPKMRNDAKQICYGIIYGMGARTLAEILKIDEASAREHIEGFYSVYPAIRAFSERTVKEARVKGFVETLAGRRRFLENISSPEAALRAQAERQAVNSLIQGSAADVAKKALLAVAGKSPKEAQFILHLHDELIFEVPEEKVPEFGMILRDAMEGCMKLSIPLRVKVKSGPNWAEMSEILL
uniref:DNA polymerase theta n=1 Tax=Lutzomyia longipalpis TaxID=7200 RepID=A0A1B0CWL4_LUTLO